MYRTIFRASYLRKAIRTVIAAIAIGATAAISFQVRELAAALLIFSIVFGTIGIAILLLVLVEEAALQGISRIATGLAHVRDRLTIFRGTLTSAHHLKSH
jgi:hypothetical protein